MFCIWCNFCWRYNVMQVNDVVSVMNGNPWVVANLAIKQLLLISVQGCWNSIYFTDTHTSTHTHTCTRKCRDYVHETRAYILQRTCHETAFVWYKKYTNYHMISKFGQIAVIFYTRGLNCALSETIRSDLLFNFYEQRYVKINLSLIVSFCSKANYCSGAH